MLSVVCFNTQVSAEGSFHVLAKSDDLVWTAMSVASFGCSLQHYDWNAEIVRQVHHEFDIPQSWYLKAQLVFGRKTEEPGPIPYNPLATVDERIKVIS